MKEDLFMADTKYGDLVKQMNFIKGRGGANAKEMVFMKGEDLAGFDLNFIVGVYDEVGDWAPGRGAHTHPFDELLLFFGYDENDMNYLGSDMELALGDEWEKQYFSVPTVVVAPRDLAHCPLVTKKVYKPFGHFHLALSPNYAAERGEQKGETDGTKYAHLVKKFDIKEGPGGANAKQIVTKTGVDLEGLNMYFQMGLYNATGEYYPGKGAQVCPYDKVLVFFGNKTDELSYLGADISIELGKEHEKYTFNVPTAVSIPKGTPHFPIVCNKVDKPYHVMEIGLGPKIESTWVD
jgi:hypothetical protein